MNNKQKAKSKLQKAKGKKQMIKVQIAKIFAFCLLLLAFCLLPFVSCQVQNQGCTDVNATNFDVTASKQIIPNNCTYPKLFLQIFPFWDSFRLSTSTIYPIGSSGDSVRILNAQMYFSNVNLFDSNNKPLAITDSLLIYRANDSLNVPQNLFLNNSNTVLYSLFSLNTVQNYRGFQIDAGLDAASQQAVAKRNPSGNPLAQQSISMYDTTSSKYYFQKMTLERHKKNVITDTIIVNGQQNFSLTYSINTSLTKGFSLTVPLQINYSKLFNNVDIRADSATRQNKIWSNLKNCITLQ